MSAPDVRIPWDLEDPKQSKPEDTEEVQDFQGEEGIDVYAPNS